MKDEKKGTDKPVHPLAYSSILRPHVQNELKNMTFRALQKACILKGMKPRHVVKADYYQLAGFYNANYFVPDNPDKLLRFDQWTERKFEPLDGINKSLRMSYVREDDISEEGFEERENEKIEKVKAKKEKKTSKPRVTNDYGIVTGTKKEFVFNLVKEGKKPEIIIKKTLKQYPDAKENSIKIWISRAKKLFDNAS